MSGVRRLAARSREYCRWAMHSTFRANLEQREGHRPPAQTWPGCAPSPIAAGVVRHPCVLVLWFLLPCPRLPAGAPALPHLANEHGLAEMATGNGGRLHLPNMPPEKVSDLLSREGVLCGLGLRRFEVLSSATYQCCDLE